MESLVYSALIVFRILKKSAEKVKRSMRMKSSIMRSDSSLWGMILGPKRGWGDVVKRKSISELIFCVSMESILSSGLT